MSALAKLLKVRKRYLIMQSKTLKSALVSGSDVVVFDMLVWVYQNLTKNSCPVQLEARLMKAELWARKPKQ